VIEPERAARLTLLALRSGVPSRLDFRPDVVRLGHNGQVVSLQDAVDDLAQRPKPLACYADVAGGVLALEFPTRIFQLSARPRGTLDEWYIERYGSDFRQRAVLCMGRFEWMIATFEELESWEAEYPVLGKTGYSGNPFTGSEDVPEDALSAARRAGAVHICDFRRRNANEREDTTGRIFIARREPPDVAASCVQCRERPARFVIEWFAGEFPRRALCQRCIDDELSPGEFDMGRSLDRERVERAAAERTKSPDELARMAEWDAIFWALRPTPPFIREFIDQYRP